MSADGSRDTCKRCGVRSAAWITTCPTCGASARYPSESISLSCEAAPPVASEISWIDIPIAADEPVLVALFRHFLIERGLQFEESRRFVSVLVADAEQIETAITPWAFQHDMPEDPRVHDSLAHTLRRIGTHVVDAIEAHRSTAGATRPTGDGSGIDLR